MDLYPYDTVCHNITRHDSYYACMHGFIHDGRLWACQSCLLGLMYICRLPYAIRCFRVMTCLGFELVGACIKGQAISFSY
jgi:hypothetical protein